MANACFERTTYDYASNTLPLEHQEGSAKLTLRLTKGPRDCGFVILPT